VHIVDSHCHIDRVDLANFGGSIESMLSHAKELSVDKFLCVCIDLENFNSVLNLAENFENIYASVGVHPTETKGKDPSIDELVALAQHEKIIAIGETGLDYFHIDKDDANWQRERFRNHIRAGKKTAKPIIVHTRDAKDDTLKIMQEENAQSGVMHCFAEDWDTAKSALDMGFYISFSGIITFKSADILREVAKKVPLDRILVETDSPYLTPVPYRGKPNSPAYTYYVVEQIAKLHNKSIDQVAGITTDNFHQLFGV